MNKCATGSIRKRKNKKGDTWQVVIELGIDEYGKRKRKTYTRDTKEEAEKLLHKKITEINEGEFQLSSNMKLSDYFQEWLTDYVKQYRSPKTYADYCGKVKQYLDPYFGNIPLQDLKLCHVQKKYSEWQEKSPYSDKGLSAETIRGINRVFKTALNQAIKLDLIKSNPLKYVMLPKVNKKAKDYFSQEEIANILNLAKDTPDYLFMLIYFTTAGRRGEITALKWCNVNWEEGYLNIKESYVEGLNNEVKLKAPKSDSSIRRIMLPETVLKELRKAYLNYKERKLLYGKEFNDDSFIFCKEKGEPYKPKSIARRYARFLKRHNIRHIKFHNSRVAQASFLAYNNVSPKAIQHYLGHSTIDMTMNVYAQFVQDEEKEVADLFENNLFKKDKTAS